MKKIIIIFTIGLLLVVSCSKDDDSVSNLGSVNPITNKQPTGSSSNDLLSDRKFKSLVIEVVYVSGFEPSSTAINNLVTFLGERINKPGGITVIKKVIPSPGKSPYSNQEIVAIEDANRTKYNTSDQIAVWAFFVDGKSEGDTNTTAVLGSSYRNTSMVIYEQTVQGMSDSPTEPNRSLLETTVISHEFGHLFGLVNFGAPLQSSHEDVEHPKHCNVESCLMYWSSQSGSSILGGTVPKLDPKCIADLRANGGK